MDCCEDEKDTHERRTENEAFPALMIYTEHAISADVDSAALSHAPTHAHLMCAPAGDTGIVAQRFS